MPEGWPLDGGASLGIAKLARPEPLSLIALARFDETGKSEVSGGATGLVAIQVFFLLSFEFSNALLHSGAPIHQRFEVCENRF